MQTTVIRQTSKTLDSVSRLRCLVWWRNYSSFLHLI